MKAALSSQDIGENIEKMHTIIANFEGLTDNAQLIDYLHTITALQATATETMASAKYWLYHAIDEELDRQAQLKGNEGIAPSIKKMRADSKCREWHYIYEYAERLARNISHVIDSTRTKISYVKMEMGQQ